MDINFRLQIYQADGTRSFVACCCPYDSPCFTASAMRGSMITNSDLQGTQFDFADFGPISNSYYGNTLIKECDLRHCSFKNANLSKVNFSGSDLRYTDFSDANLMGAEFNDVLFDETTIFPDGFDTSKHLKR